MDTNLKKLRQLKTTATIITTRFKKSKKNQIQRLVKKLIARLHLRNSHNLILLGNMKER